MFICSFSTHGQILPSTVATVNEIAKHVDRVFVLVDEDQDIEFPKNIEYFKCANKGLDFGKHLQLILHLKELGFKYNEMLFSNDTIDAISSFDELFSFGKKSKADFWGATDGHSDFSGNRDVDGRHIQSFFISFRGKALDSMVEYMIRHGYKPKREGVAIYEMGFSRMLLKQGFKGEAFIKCADIMEKYGLYRFHMENFKKTGRHIEQEGGEFNGSFEYPHLYIEEGLPFVKNTCMKYCYKPPIIQYMANKLYLQNCK